MWPHYIKHEQLFAWEELPKKWDSIVSLVILNTLGGLECLLTQDSSHRNPMYLYD